MVYYLSTSWRKAQNLHKIYKFNSFKIEFNCTEPGKYTNSFEQNMTIV